MTKCRSRAAGSPIIRNGSSLRFWSSSSLTVTCFSTVRMADRIIVLRHGKVEEQGSHEELLAKHGLYEELFTMQAAGYR